MFLPLTEKEIKQIVVLQIKSVQKMLSGNGVELVLSLIHILTNPHTELNTKKKLEQQGFITYVPLVSVRRCCYEKAVPLLEQGIQVERTLQACVRDADVVCTMVGYPTDVKEIYEGDDGIFTHAKEHAVLIDFTTSSPALAKKLYTAAKAKGFAMLDAPVSGGDSGAKAAALSIMIGGDEKVFEQRCV